MAILRMTNPWRDPRTGIWTLRKWIPAKYRGVTGRTGDTVKISTGTKDNGEALRRWPGALQQWAELEAGWERKLNVVALTPERVREIAERWLEGVANGEVVIATDGRASDVFDPLALPEARTPAGLEAMRVVVEPRAAEALRMAGIEATEDTYPLLVLEMTYAVSTAYLQADFVPIVSKLERPREARQGEPGDRTARPTKRVGGAPPALLGDLFRSWKGIATVKPRVVEETRYAIEALEKFLGDPDAQKINRRDLARWRDEFKAKGRNNNT